MTRCLSKNCSIDFEGERQHLHEVVVPRLEAYCNALSLDLLVVDPHWQMQPNPTTIEPTSGEASNAPPTKPDLVCNGTKLQASEAGKRGPNSVPPIIYDYNSNCINPHEFELQLKEIEECSHQSVTTFFMVS